MKVIIYFINYCYRTLFVRAKDPFIRKFIYDVLRPAYNLTEPVFIENYRKVLALNHSELKTINLGAGSRFASKQISIAKASVRSSIRPGYGKLLQQMVSFFRPDIIIELGTAMGISTSYLASGSTNARVITVEANPQLSDLAYNFFIKNGLNRITLINKAFDDVLPDFESLTGSSLLVFIDGNHTYEGMKRYYRFFSNLNEKAILIFDDIHWSSGMHKAWKEIQKSTESGTTIDLFQMGIVFQGKKKRNVALWY